MGRGFMESGSASSRLRNLKIHFPELAGKLELCVPGEKSRRIGQAMAAATLPP
jgi:hypothetical protein